MSGGEHESGHNIFHPDSTTFKATIISMSVALLVFITCSAGFAGVRHLRQKRSEDVEAGKTSGKFVCKRNGHKHVGRWT